MFRRIAPLALLLLAPVLVTACDRGGHRDDASPSGSAGSAPGTDDGDSGSGSGSSAPTSSAPPVVRLPANACGLLDAATVARLVGGSGATGKPSTQGPFHSCEYTVSGRNSGSASVFLDAAGERAQQLYDLATGGAKVTPLSVGAEQAGYDASTGKVYLLTRGAFLSIQLPLGFGSLTTPDALRSAAQGLSRQAVDRVGH
jgi:hypothetical protein